MKLYLFISFMVLLVGGSVWAYISYFIALGEAIGVADQCSRDNGGCSGG